MEEAGNIKERTRSERRNRNRYKYINPDSSESEDDRAEVRIRNPPTSKSIYSNYIKIVRSRLAGSEPEYWEWKAG